VESSRPPCATFFGCQKQDHRENRYLESLLRPHLTCIFIQYHYILGLRPMPIGPGRSKIIGFAPVLTHKDSRGRIRVSEKTRSRQSSE
jgi:hypothetical protein